MNIVKRIEPYYSVQTEQCGESDISRLTEEIRCVFKRLQVDRPVLDETRSELVSVSLSSSGRFVATETPEHCSSAQVFMIVELANHPEISLSSCNDLEIVRL